SENRSTLFDYEGFGGEGRTHPVPFEFTSAEPNELSGNNESASAVEFLLHALAASLVTTFVFRAAAIGVAIESLFTQVEGEVDVRGMLGMEDAPASGYERIRVGMDVKANCPDELITEIAEFARVHSPVCNTIMRAVEVRIERPAA
ncbi:MAG TPA: OsmC family protein, partial [Sphingomonadaceae bacterium]|nr:OsmC family protein [Sphingomonadaceae bacterium]